MTPSPKRRRRLLVAAAILSLALATIAHATSTGWIFLGGPIADQGVGVAPLGEVDIAISGNHTVTTTEFRGASIQVTGSLSADATLTVPLESGAFKYVTNNTTGGHNVIWAGASGTSVTIPSTAGANTFAVNCPDGANWVSAGGGSVGGGGFDAGAYSGAPGYLYYDGGSLVWAPASLTPGGDLDGSATLQYVVGLEGNPIDPATCRTPSSSNRIYFDGSKWVCAAMSLTGDTTGSPVGTSTTTTVVSATGNGTSPYDAGGTVFNVGATGECLATGTNGTFCAQEAPTVFSDATTWQTIVQRAWTVNQPMHFFVLFTADDFSGDGGSITKNFVNVQLEAHAMPDTVAVLFAPQAGADFGPGPIPLAPLKNNFVTGCTTNNSDAGCTPSAGGTTGWTFQILSATVSGTSVVQVQAKAVGTTRWPWKGHAIVNEQRSAP